MFYFTLVTVSGQTLTVLLYTETPNVMLRIDSNTANPREGETVELTCHITGDLPTSALTWTKVDGSIGDNVQTFGNVLRFVRR